MGKLETNKRLSIKPSVQIDLLQEEHDRYVPQTDTAIRVHEHSLSLTKVPLSQTSKKSMEDAIAKVVSSKAHMIDHQYIQVIIVLVHCLK
jgi:hypothetical protein